MSNTSNSLYYSVALSLTPGIGPVSARKLLLAFENAENIYKESKRSIKKKQLINPLLVDKLFSKEVLESADIEMGFIDKYQINVLYYEQDNYPYRLQSCPDAPIILYSKGNVRYNELKVISIVGTRRSTEYGREFTSKLIADLKKEPVVIVSGLAHGIDTYAHQYAVENELPTIAVLGHGLQMIYPAANKALAKQIIENGSLLTEFSSQSIPEKENFPRRNRIIAGLSDAIIVVEANIKGGALITAEIATTYNRDVFAVPGKTTDTYSKGCNWLIKTNKAGLITSAEDLYYNMNWEFAHTRKTSKQTSLILTEDEEKIFRILHEFGQSNIDFICNTSLFSLSKTATVLLQMEMSGIIKSLPGKMYRLQ
jgi:DNA processing protein